MTAGTLFGFKDFTESESFTTTLTKEMKSSCFDSDLVVKRILDFRCVHRCGSVCRSEQFGYRCNWDEEPDCEC